MSTAITTVANPLLDAYTTARATSEAARPGECGWGLGFPHDPVKPWGEMDRCRREYGYAIPTSEAIQTIAARGPVVEIGAGSGYWAWQLWQAGCDVVAFDPSPPGGTRRAYFQDGNWFPVRRGDHRMAAQYPNRTLLLVWPCYDRRWAWSAVYAHMKAGGTRVAYVGEWRGCTGDVRLHNLLEREYEMEAGVELPTWFGLYGRVRMFARKDDR